jgi:hypothetical protein
MFGEFFGEVIGGLWERLDGEEAYLPRPDAADVPAVREHDAEVSVKFGVGYLTEYYGVDEAQTVTEAPEEVRTTDTQSPTGLEHTADTDEEAFERVRQIEAARRAADQATIGRLSTEHTDDFSKAA